MPPLTPTAPLPPDLERAALAELDAWCATRGLMPASVRRVELLEQRAREEHRRQLARDRREREIRALLATYRSSERSARQAAGDPSRPKRPRGRNAVKRTAWACPHTDRPNCSYGRCATCTKAEWRRAHGATPRRKGRDVARQRERQRECRAKRAARRGSS